MATYQDNLFTRGPSPMARVTFFALLAIAIMIADHRFQALGAIRLTVNTVLNPIEQVLSLPGRAVDSVGNYFRDQSALAAENRALNEKVLALAAEGQRARLLIAEQAQVDVLKQAHSRFQREGIIAEIIRDARNPFSRRVIINRGRQHGVSAGAVVIDGAGVVGQVTNLGTNSAEVTLITEKDQSVPVMVVRNSLRAVAIGNGREGMIELPFLAASADLQEGDLLVTSGIDGTYPAGLAVATVTIVDKNPAFSFARIIAKPTNAPNHFRFVNVLSAPRTTSAEGDGDAYPVADVIGNDTSGIGDKSGNKRDTKQDAKRQQRNKAAGNQSTTGGR
jgi:rod shape-determining protein MreC